MITRRLALAACLGLALFGGSPQARAEIGTLRIGLQFGLVYLPVVVAQSEGLIVKRAEAAGVPGLKIELARFSGSTAMNEAVLSNSIELGTLGTVGALIIWDRTRGRQHVKSIAGLSTINYALYTNKPNIKALADFTTNDKIAVTAGNSPQAILLRVAAEKSLGDKAKADPLMINLPHPDATAALLAGQAISGYFATPPFSQVLERNAKITKVLTSRDLLGMDPTATTIITSQAFVDDNPKVAKAILDGLEDAMTLINTDPKRAAAIYLQSEKVQLAPADVEKILTDGSMTFSTTPTGIMIWAKHMSGQGMLRKLPDGWKDAFFPMIGDRKGD